MSSDPKLPVGSNKCNCAACGAYFGGVTALDKHRLGGYPDRVCLDAGAMAKAGLQLNAKGYWSRKYMGLPK